MELDPKDLALLKEIADAPGGRKVFKPRSGQSPEDFDEEVERLLRPRKRELITMQPDPKRSSQSKAGNYILTGECRLTIEGKEILKRYGQ